MHTSRSPPGQLSRDTSVAIEVEGQAGRGGAQEVGLGAAQESGGARGKSGQ